MQAATRSGFSLIGGGHSSATAGHGLPAGPCIHWRWACIDFLAGENLPGIEALKEAAARYRARQVELLDFENNYLNYNDFY